MESINLSYEGAQKYLQEANREMLESEIKLLALKQIAKDNDLDLCLRKKLLYLFSLKHEDLSNLELQDGCETYLYGLTKEMTSQFSEVNFTSSEKQLIKDKYIKELGKVTKEISDTVIELTTEIPSDTDICKMAQDLQKLGMDVTAEVENLDECQNSFIHLKYKTVLGKLLKEVEKSEKGLKSIFENASDLYDKTLNAVYPSKDYYDKIENAEKLLEQELIKVNEELVEAQKLQEMYSKLNQQEFKSIIKDYKDVMRNIKMKEMVLKEMKHEK